MCRKCKHKTGSTKHLLYWQAEWFKRFALTWWHIVNRRAYRTWQVRSKADSILKANIPDEGMRMELDEFLSIGKKYE